MAIACLFKAGQPVASRELEAVDQGDRWEEELWDLLQLKAGKVKTGKGKKKKTKLVWKFGKKIVTTKELKLAHVQSRSYKLARGRRYYYV
ncbi:hypothetical protein ACXO3P_00440 [Lactobacillus delbrueckii subsp. bulgaricus]